MVSNNVCFDVMVNIFFNCGHSRRVIRRYSEKAMMVYDLTVTIDTLDECIFCETVERVIGCSTTWMGDDIIIGKFSK